MIEWIAMMLAEVGECKQVRIADLKQIKTEFWKSRQDFGRTHLHLADSLFNRRFP